MPLASQVLVAPDNTLVPFYSGEPLPARFHKNCTPGTGELLVSGYAEPQHRGEFEPPGPPGYEKIGCVLSIATSTSWDRPFDARPNVTSFTPLGAEKLFCHTNPSAWIFPNGSTLLYFRSASSKGASEQIWLATAPHYLGPYTLRGGDSASPLFPIINYEDPFVFRNSRGHFVMLLHRQGGGAIQPHGQFGAKAFSRDGLEWQWTNESMAGDVWNGSMVYTDGSVVTFAAREEPKLYVEGGGMKALFNVVLQMPGFTSYVMSQAIKTSAGL